MTPIGIAIVGAGFWGKNLIRNFAAIPDARVVHLCDLDAERLAAASALAPDALPTPALAGVLADPSVTAVVVATPAESHRAVSLACLDAGKHVFVEKPIATSRVDAEAIIDAADRRGLVLMVGHLFMYDPAVRTSIDLVRGGRVGDVRYVHSIRTSMAGLARLDTNIVWDALIHDAYILAALLGRPPHRVLVNGQGYLSALEDVAFATFDFGDGVLAQCYASWYALEKARRLTVVGRDGILQLDEFADPKLAFYKRRYAPSGSIDPQGRPRWQWIDEGMEPVAVDAGQPLRIECEHFLDCVRTGATPRTPGSAALEAVAVIEACQASLSAGGVWTSC